VLEVNIPVHVENSLVVVGAQLLQLFPLNQVHEDVQLHLKDEKQLVKPAHVVTSIKQSPFPCPVIENFT